MTPKQASEVEYEEPDWRERFEAHCARWPNLPRYLQEEGAFEATLKDWRRFHWTPVEVDGKQKKQPAGATEGMIALAKLSIMPSRSAWSPIERDGELGYQQDEHMWLSISQEQWRITGVEDRILHLQKGFENELETKQIDLAKAKWNQYIEGMTAVLAAMTEGNR